MTSCCSRSCSTSPSIDRSRSSPAARSRRPRAAPRPACARARPRRRRRRGWSGRGRALTDELTISLVLFASELRITSSTCTRDRNALFSHERCEKDSRDPTGHAPPPQPAHPAVRLFCWLGCVLVIDALVGDKGLLAMIQARQEYRTLEQIAGRGPQRERAAARGGPAPARGPVGRSRISPAASSA